MPSPTLSVVCPNTYYKEKIHSWKFYRNLPCAKVWFSGGRKQEATRGSTSEISNSKKIKWCKVVKRKKAQFTVFATHKARPSVWFSLTRGVIEVERRQGPLSCLLFGDDNNAPLFHLYKLRNCSVIRNNHRLKAMEDVLISDLKWRVINFTAQSSNYSFPVFCLGNLHESRHAPNLGKIC